MVFIIKLMGKIFYLSYFLNKIEILYYRIFIIIVGKFFDFVLNNIFKIIKMKIRTLFFIISISSMSYLNGQVVASDDVIL